MENNVSKIELPQLVGYVIYHPRLGLFSAGGSYRKWRKKPKIWNSLGAFKNHLHFDITTKYAEKKFIIGKRYQECKIYLYPDQMEYHLTPHEMIYELCLHKITSRDYYKNFTIEYET